MQLLGADVNITWQNIVHDDVLDEGTPVMLFLVEGLGIVQGNIGQLAEAAGDLIVAAAENRILKIVGIADDRLKALLSKGNDGVGRTANLQRSVAPPFPQHGHIGAGNYTALGIDDTKNAVGHIF